MRDHLTDPCHALLHFLSILLGRIRELLAQSYRAFFLSPCFPRRSIILDVHAFPILLC